MLILFWPSSIPHLSGQPEAPDDRRFVIGNPALLGKGESPVDHSDLDDDKSGLPPLNTAVESSPPGRCQDTDPAHPCETDRSNIA